MKKRVVFLITIILIITGILLINNKIQATEKSLSCSIETEKTEIKQGEETSITIKINSEEQINAFQAKINYDENLWEEIDENNFETKDGWESLKYNKDSKEFNVINKQDTTNKDILEIKLKAKTSANVGNTEITIDEITASDGNTEFKNENLSNDILIKVNESLINKPTNPEEPTTPEKPSKPENKIENTTGNTTENTATEDTINNTVGNTTIENTTDNTVGNTITENETENKIDNTTKNNNKTETKLPKIFPKTGAGTIIQKILIILVIIAIILLYCKNMNNRKTLMMLIICGILITQSTVFAASEIFLGDINQSSVIDDEDIEIMQEYLINSKDVTSFEQADMNSDSKLSIIDLSLLIKQQKECPYDKNNVTNITSWSAVPMVSKELLQKQGVTTGGEGCQWPIGMAISKDGKLVLYGTDVGGIYRSEDGGKNWEQSNVGLQSRGAGAFSIDPKNPSYVVAVGINSSPFNTNGLYISEVG